MSDEQSMWSGRFRYGLRALIALADGERQTAGAIADEHDLPAKFLEVILRDLANAGLLTSARGKLGGYRLALPAQQVSLAAVADALWPEVAASLDAGAEQVVLNDLRRLLYARLERTTVADAAMRAARARYVLDYAI